jgi:hypothetical protein
VQRAGMKQESAAWPRFPGFPISGSDQNWLPNVNWIRSS